MCEDEVVGCMECEAEQAYKIIALRDALEWLLNESDEYCRKRSLDAGYCFVRGTDAAENARKVLLDYPPVLGIWEPNVLQEMVAALEPFEKLWLMPPDQRARVVTALNKARSQLNLLWRVK
jgi:hypothetical protein